jgi:acetyltransferase-like isoleucine patch superfamily enzyme
VRYTQALRILIPPREWILNHLVCRIPFASMRMAAYARLGVDLEDHRTGVIMLGAHVAAPKQLRIGRNTAIGRRCVLDARGKPGITIGQNVNIGSYCRLQTGKHLINDPYFKGVGGEIVVGDRAWIAEGATVLTDVHIGEGAVVMGGAVVTKDVDPYTVVAGVPARRIGERSRDLRYELDYRPDWI